MKDADAHLTVMCPRSGLGAEMKHRIFEEKVVDAYLDQTFSVENGDALVEGYDMILTAIDDSDLSRSICELARRHKIPVNVADVPPECDFYFGSLIRRGPLQVMVSTGGKGPRIAASTRATIERALPENIGPAIEKVGQLRAMLRKRAPDQKQGPKRMRWMIDVCDAWTVDELATMTPHEMDQILEGWEAGKIKNARQVRGWAWWAAPSWQGTKKALFGTCPVVGYPSPWSAGIGGAFAGAAAATVFFATTNRLRR